MWYPSPILQFFDSNGNPLTGGKLYTYINGTTTPKATYSDSALSVQNDNPIILDSRGEAGPIYGFGYYKFVLKDSDDTEIWSADDIWGIGCCSQVEVFQDSDLDGNNQLTIAHEYNQAYLHVTVFNSSGEIVRPDNVDCSSTTQIVITFNPDITLTGNWRARYGL